MDNGRSSRVENVFATNWPSLPAMSPLTVNNIIAMNQPQRRAARPRHQVFSLYYMTLIGWNVKDTKTACV